MRGAPRDSWFGAIASSRSARGRRCIRPAVAQTVDACLRKLDITAPKSPVAATPIRILALQLTVLSQRRDELTRQGYDSVHRRKRIEHRVAWRQERAARERHLGQHPHEREGEPRAVRGRQVLPHRCIEHERRDAKTAMCRCFLLGKHVREHAKTNGRDSQHRQHAKWTAAHATRIATPRRRAKLDPHAKQRGTPLRAARLACCAWSKRVGTERRGGGAKCVRRCAHAKQRGMPLLAARIALRAGQSAPLT